MFKPHFYFDILTKKLDSFVFYLEPRIQVACLQNLSCVANLFPIILQNVLRKMLPIFQNEFLVNNNKHAIKFILLRNYANFFFRNSLQIKLCTCIKKVF